MKPIKIVKIYADDHPKLTKLRRELTRLEGEQASYADVVRYLVNQHAELVAERHTTMRAWK